MPHNIPDPVLSMPSATLQNRLRALARLHRSLGAQKSPGALLMATACGAVELLGWERCIVLYNLDDHTLHAECERDKGPARVSAVERALQEHDLIRLIREKLGPEAAAVPVLCGTQVAGALAVQDAQDTPEGLKWILSFIAASVADIMTHMPEHKGSDEGYGASIEEILSERTSRQSMMSALAHDLYSPLRTINIGCDLLQRSMASPTEDQAELIEHIRIATRHLDALASNLVEMGRINAGLASLSRVPCSIETIAHESAAIVLPDFQMRNQTLDSQVTPCTTEADPDRLRQVLINLLGNASKYSPNGSRIRLFTDNEAGFVRIHVADEGPGIPDGQHEAIFRPYYRWAAGAIPGSSGVGLGLAISRELVHRMGGRISLESAEGQGSTFTVTLPLSCDDD